MFSIKHLFKKAKPMNTIPPEVAAGSWPASSKGCPWMPEYMLQEVGIRPGRTSQASVGAGPTVANTKSLSSTHHGQTPISVLVADAAAHDETAGAEDDSRVAGTAKQACWREASRPCSAGNLYGPFWENVHRHGRLLRPVPGKVASRPHAIPRNRCRFRARACRRTRPPTREELFAGASRGGPSGKSRPRPSIAQSVKRFGRLAGPAIPGRVRTGGPWPSRFPFSCRAVGLAGFSSSGWPASGFSGG